MKWKPNFKWKFKLRKRKSRDLSEPKIQLKNIKWRRWLAAGMFFVIMTFAAASVIGGYKADQEAVMYAAANERAEHQMEFNLGILQDRLLLASAELSALNQSYKQIVRSLNDLSTVSDNETAIVELTRDINELQMKLVQTTDRTIGIDSQLNTTVTKLRAGAYSTGGGGGGSRRSTTIFVDSGSATTS